MIFSNLYYLKSNITMCILSYIYHIFYCILYHIIYVFLCNCYYRMYEWSACLKPPWDSLRTREFWQNLFQSVHIDDLSHFKERILFWNWSHGSLCLILDLFGCSQVLNHNFLSKIVKSSICMWSLPFEVLICEWGRLL